jgi:hypothetical protein
MPGVIALRQFYTRERWDAADMQNTTADTGGKRVLLPSKYAGTEKVVLFGPSGMVGQGVLRECLLDPQISEVVSIVRRSTGEHDAKVREVSQLSETA